MPTKLIIHFEKWKYEIHSYFVICHGYVLVVNERDIYQEYLTAISDEKNILLFLNEFFQYISHFNVIRHP